MPRGIFDILNLTQKATPKRLINAGKVLGSYYYSRFTKRPIQKGLPISISIEPTTACNLRCPECPSGLRKFSRNTGNIDINLFRTFINSIYKHTLYLNFYFQGEPYIHPQFLEMVQYASKKKIYTSTSTNAHFLDDEMAKKTVQSGLNRLIISLDGITQEVYEQYRIKGNIDKVFQGVANIIKWKKQLKSRTPYIIFQFLVVKPNEHQIEDAKKIANEMGVNSIRFKTAQIYDYKNGNPLIPDNSKYSRYKKLKNGQYAIKNGLANHCWKLWHSCVVTWDGLVVPCCFDKDATHKMGNITQYSLAEVWQNKQYKNFRNAIVQSRSSIDICTNCTEGTKVWA